MNVTSSCNPLLPLKGNSSEHLPSLYHQFNSLISYLISSLLSYLPHSILFYVCPFSTHHETDNCNDILEKCQGNLKAQPHMQHLHGGSVSLDFLK